RRCRRCVPPRAGRPGRGTGGSGMRRDTVSVLINNFNYAEFVGAAIQSAVAQGPGVEVIVVDDGSTDDSREAIEAHSDRVTAIFQENAGQAAAFNTGFAASRGEIVVF